MFTKSPVTCDANGSLDSAVYVYDSISRLTDLIGVSFVAALFISATLFILHIISGGSGSQTLGISYSGSALVYTPFGR